jgi:hypothetical protein
MTGQNLVLSTFPSPILLGSAVQNVGSYVQALDPVSAQDFCNAAGPGGSGVQSSTNVSATSLDRVIFDFAMKGLSLGIGSQILSFGKFIGGFNKNGALYVTFTGTTPVNIDLTALATAIGVTSSQAGDTSLATFNCLIMQNLSASISTLTVSPGASNPAPLPNALGGTTPTIALALGAVHCEYDAAGKTIDSTHRIITVTPSAGGALGFAYGGS